MFGRKPRIELDVLGNYPELGLSEDEHVSQTLGKICKTFDFVQNQIKKNIDYQLKEYSLDHKANYEVDSHAFVFNPMRKSGEAAKLNEDGPYLLLSQRKLMKSALNWYH